MCFNCGCHNPHDNMSNKDNITTETLEHLAEHGGKSLGEMEKLLLGWLENNNSKLEKDPHLKEMFDKAAKAWGQSVDEAKKNTLSLLKSEIED